MVLFLSGAYRLIFFFSSSGDHRDLHSFPTRRSSDLRPAAHPRALPRAFDGSVREIAGTRRAPADRKSTRLNSSHSQISYAVFCLKKKTDDHRFLSDRHLRPTLAAAEGFANVRRSFLG